MGLVLDSGAFLAIERGDRELMALLKRELLRDQIPVTHGGIVGQVWRGDRRQVRLARILRSIKIADLGEELGRRAGVLLGRVRRSDVIDAAIVLLARDGDSILTSDPGDLRTLAEAAGTHLDLIPV